MGNIYLRLFLSFGYSFRMLCIDLVMCEFMRLLTFNIYLDISAQDFTDFFLIISLIYIPPKAFLSFFVLYFSKKMRRMYSKLWSSILISLLYAGVMWATWLRVGGESFFREYGLVFLITQAIFFAILFGISFSAKYVGNNWKIQNK